MEMDETIAVKVGDLKGPALDWAVAQIDSFCTGLEWRPRAEGRLFVGFGMIENVTQPCAYLSNGSSISERFGMRRNGVEPYSPSTDWSQGGRLIEQHCISLLTYESSDWWAGFDLDHGEPSGANAFGETPLIAACRALVAAKIGQTVEVPTILVTS